MAGVAPLTPADAIGMIKRITGADGSYLFTLHNLDFEYLYSILKIAEEQKVNCYIASAQIENSIEKLPSSFKHLNVIDEYTDGPSHFTKVPMNEISKKSFILVSSWNIVDFLKTLTSEKRYGKIIAILSEPEPEIEEFSEYNIVSNWMSKMGIEHYRIRVSGHYYPYEIKNVKKIIKPKRVMPIHSERPELTKRLWTKS